jgi:hypothetical protein
MTNDASAILDDILIRWWNWRAPIQPTRGHNRSAMGFESYRTSRQYDDENGALDDDIENQRMEAVSRQIDSLESLHRIAIYVQARALTLGVAVFTNARLPTSKTERDLLVMQARSELMRKIVAAGIA